MESDLQMNIGRGWWYVSKDNTFLNDRQGRHVNYIDDR